MSTAKDDEDPREDGCEPTEEVGPEECAPSPARCGHGPGDLEGGPEEGFDSMDELHEMFQPEPYQAFVDTDGVATPVDPQGETPLDPPFTYRHLVCIEDDRKYVELFLGEEGAIPDDRVSRATKPRERHDPFGHERERRVFDGDSVIRTFGRCYATLDDGSVLLVRPRRPRCVHYKRQLFNLDGTDCDKPGGKIRFSNCMARRSNGGAYMSLNKQAVYACDYRCPRDDASVEKYFDSHDRERLKNKPHLTMVPMLGFSGEDVRLEEKADPDDDD